MDELQSETTQEWRLPDSAKPPLIGELVERIDEALATARASEAAVMTVGAAALDAAEQAKRAAELAERASRGVAAVPSPSAGMDDFATRADRLAERLRRLQRLPLDREARQGVASTNLDLRAASDVHTL
jgi:hypothetical protein